MTRAAAWAITGLLIVLQLGCRADVPGVQDGGVPDPDGGGQEEPDAGWEGQPVSRTLLRTGLMGGLPVDNRVLDPLFTLTSLGWFATGTGPSGEGGPAEVRARRLPALPAGRGAVEVVPSRGERVTLAGLARGGPGDLRAELWVGRANEDAPPPVVAIVGHDPATHADTAVDLALEGRETREGITWERYRAWVPGGLWGWAVLTVTGTGNHPFLVAGAVVVPDPAPPAPSGALVVGPRRPSAAEEAAAAALKRRVRDNLGSMPRPGGGPRRPAAAR